MNIMDRTRGLTNNNIRAKTRGLTNSDNGTSGLKNNKTNTIKLIDNITSRSLNFK